MKNIINRTIVLSLVVLAFSLNFLSCSSNEKNPVDSFSKTISFGIPIRVNIIGYNDHIMEPFLSRDGNTMFFNNLNNPNVNTNLHYALKVNDSTFQYQGELLGINTATLEGVATMDDFGNFYFVSTRSYNTSFSTIYMGNMVSDSITNVDLVAGISKNMAGWVNFDVEVSADGNSLYFVDGTFDENGGPYEADLRLAIKSNGIFQRADDTLILKNINSDSLEYAACISSNMLELYFTRVEAPLTILSVPQIYISTRESVSDPFGLPSKISEITGFVEAATITSNGNIIYYHKLENSKYNLYMVKKELPITAEREFFFLPF